MTGAASGEGVSSDYTLRWPRDLFKREVSELLNRRGTLTDWNERCELLLEDAFVSNVPRDDFQSVAGTLSGYGQGGSSQLGSSQQFLVGILRRADNYKEVGNRTPYWSERRASSTSRLITLEAAAREFVRLINDLDSRGYLEQSFEKDCVDAPSAIDPSSVLEMELGVPGLWPLSALYLVDHRDTFFDVVEAMHDLVARPRSRNYHNYSGCGWHHRDFSVASGQAVYRWLVNRLLDRTDVGLHLAGEGEDVGRLITMTDPARTRLVQTMAEREDRATGDVVRHALALFRSRGATEHDKRSAIVALAGVLEERRGLLKSRLVRKDEGALFQIANEFAIRHRRDDQKSDYDPAFLDWIYYWYLSTIELTDRLLARN